MYPASWQEMNSKTAATKFQQWAKWSKLMVWLKYALWCFFKLLLLKKATVYSNVLAKSQIIRLNVRSNFNFLHHLHASIYSLRQKSGLKCLNTKIYLKFAAVWSINLYEKWNYVFTADGAVWVSLRTGV